LGARKAQDWQSFDDASTILLCYDVGKAASIAHFMRWSKPAELEPSRSRALRERYLIGS